LLKKDRLARDTEYINLLLVNCILKIVVYRSWGKLEFKSVETEIFR
jgi:hypothetical protein